MSIKTDQLLKIGQTRAPDEGASALTFVTVLAVHNDIGFLFALALQLVHRRVNLIPASSVKNAERLLAELQLQPDLLIVNCKMQGVCALGADSLKRWPALKVVAIVSEGHRCLKCRRLLVATLEDAPSPRIDRWVGFLRMLTSESHSATQ